MRDLRKDLETFNNAVVAIVNGDMGEWVETVLPEAITRAIMAEDKLAEVMNDKMWREYDQKCERLAEENDLQRQSIQNLSAQVAALREALNDVYPMIAGRVIQLIDAGEEWVAGQWNKEAKKILTVLEGVEE